MHNFHTKGTTVKPTKHQAQTASLKTALALLGACFRGPGRGLPSSIRVLAADAQSPHLSFMMVERRKRRFSLALALLPIVFALTAGTVPALGAEETTGPPQAHIVLKGVRSTRAMVAASVLPNGSLTSWTLEMATSENGPWTSLYSATVKPSDEVSRREHVAIYHHLAPNTTYYLRVVATNSSGTTTEMHITIESNGTETKVGHFTTPPVGSPEIFGLERDDPIAPAGVVADKPIGCDSRATSVDCETHVETNGAETEYHLEYATSEGGPFSPFSSGAVGAITVAEDFAQPKATLTGLTPETTYYVRARASNTAGSASVVEPFKTGLAKPASTIPTVTNVTATSAHLNTTFIPSNFETHWRFEYATGEGGPWAVVPGGSGIILASEATEEHKYRGADPNGLSPGTVYYVRFFAENKYGSSTSQIQGFETAGPPAATTFAVHALDSEGIRAIGAVAPNGTNTNEEQAVTIGGGATGGTFTLTFDGHTTAPIPFSAQEFEVTRVARALEALPSIGEGDVYVTGGAVEGSYTVEFQGDLAGTDFPQMTADASGLAPSGTINVATVQNGSQFDAHYHFEYTTTDFARCGTPANSDCLTTPEVDLGAGETVVGQVNGHPLNSFASRFAGEDLPSLQPGTTYHYRLVATNTAPGDPVVDGAEHTVTVPASALVEPSPVCPNEALRIGPSARLPDCRAYEQVTPAEKGGTEDVYKYGLRAEHTAIGADGDHVMIDAPGVQWGSSPDPTHSTYVLSRDAEIGWQATSARPLSETDSITYFEPALWNVDLTQLAFDQVGWVTADGNRSPTVELKVGPPGGPYVKAATIPRSQVEFGQGFVAASADATKYVIQTEDHKLLGRPTGTTSGSDLYEFSAGQLRQLNVLGGSPGSSISTCGAQMASGTASHGAQHQGVQSAVSDDGSRVFFTDNCTHDLYMRVNGAETVDIGEYRFAAADAAASKVLLAKGSQAQEEVFLYDTETHTASLLPGARSGEISEGFTTIYFRADEQLTSEAPQLTKDAGTTALDVYRYDIPTRTLRFLFQIPGHASGEEYVSPDGRYFYFGASTIGGETARVNSQAYRYDNADGVVQCMSCASSFDPNPKLGSYFEGESGVPHMTVASANGDYVFFDTPAALVPQDVDGEVAPEVVGGEHLEHFSATYSVSSDVYEWRKNGIDGCGDIQGCLALITSGRGGYKNELLGTTLTGRDVFIATHESLVSQDMDSAGDVYDVRIGGGFPPLPPRPTECEADACSTPLAAPIDATPASLTFSGAGNSVPLLEVPKRKAKPRAKQCRKGTVRKSGRCVKVKRGAKNARRRVFGRDHGGRK